MSISNIKTLCRICLGYNNVVLSLFGEYNDYILSDLINTLCGSELIHDPEFPSNICQECADRLITGYEIRKLSLDSEKYLRECFGKEFEYLEDNNSFGEIEEFEKIHDEIEAKDTSLRQTTIELSKNETIMESQFEEDAEKLEFHELKVEHNSNSNICFENTDEDISKDVHDNSTQELYNAVKENPPEAIKLDINISRKASILPNICPICKKSFTLKSNLKRHLKSHNGKDILTCDKCNKTFSQSAQLYKHMKMHRQIPEDNDDYILRCEICGETSTSYAVFSDHMRSEHNYSGKLRPYTCSQCDMRFISKQGLFRHVDNLHDNNRLNLRDRTKNYLCNTCGKNFHTNFHLEVHMRSHTGEKPYKCEYCGKSFSQKSGLRMHIYTHTGERPFECKECGKSFKQYGHIQEHLRTHNECKPYVCSICHQSFRVKGNLTSHMLIHSGTKQFSCTECGKLFFQNSKLKAHINRFHNRKVAETVVVSENIIKEEIFE